MQPDDVEFDTSNCLVYPVTSILLPCMLLSPALDEYLLVALRCTGAHIVVNVHQGETMHFEYIADASKYDTVCCTESINHNGKFINTTAQLDLSLRNKLLWTRLHTRKSAGGSYFSQGAQDAWSNCMMGT